MQDLGRLVIWLLCQQDIIDDPLRITIIIQWKFRAIFKTEQIKYHKFVEKHEQIKESNTWVLRRSKKKPSSYNNVNRQMFSVLTICKLNATIQKYFTRVD